MLEENIMPLQNTGLPTEWLTVFTILLKITRVCQFSLKLGKCSFTLSLNNIPIKYYNPVKNPGLTPLLEKPSVTKFSTFQLYP